MEDDLPSACPTGAPNDSSTVPMEVDATTEDASVLSLSTTGLGSVAAPVPSQGQVPLKRASTDPTRLEHSTEPNIGSTSTSNDSKTASNAFSSSYAAMSDFQPSVAMLRKHWEGVIDGKGMQFDSLKRLFVGDSETISEAGSYLNDSSSSFYTPLALRHTHSTPLKKAPSILDEYAVRTGLPPPIPLDPFQRSTSTPSAFRTRSVNSAFGSVLSASPSNTEDDCSLVGVQYVSMGGEQLVNYRCSAFDPVQYYARQLEDMAVQEDMERTTIEVTDAVMSSSTDSAAPQSPSKRRPKRGAAVAERFLANVRVFRRRRRSRHAASFRSSSSVQPRSSTLTDAEDEDDQSVAASVPLPQTTVTVTTESDNTPTGIGSLGPTSLVKHNSLPLSLTNTKMCTSPDQEEPLEPAAPTYHRFDSDVEEDVHYQKIETSLQTESPPPVSSPTQEHVKDHRIPGNHVRIQVSGKKTPPVSSLFAKENTSPVPFDTTTPTPHRLSRSLDSALTQRSNDSMTDSPQTNRSSNTGSSSMGHTTQATSCSSIQQSNLSTISETDREVMIANKEGKRRRDLEDTLQMNSKPDFIPSTESVNSSSTNSNSTGTNPHGYLALQANPLPRDGANVAMDRFFSNRGANLGNLQTRVHSLGNSSSSRKSGQSSSPGTDGSSAITHTSSSRSSPSEPPTFVSCLYKKNASDLTSTREEMESCDSRSGGGENEEREGSPAPIVAYQPLYFEGASLLSDQQVPKPLRPPSRPDKFRSRPPRSPVKGSRMITTPPPCRTPPLYQQLSPPARHVAEPLHQQNVSQPYVLRTTETGKSLVSVVDTRSGIAEEQVDDDDGGVEVMHGITYEEHSIEIMKSNSKDDLLPSSK